MNTVVIAGALLLVFFSESPLLMRSAGLDNAERFSRSPVRSLAVSAVIAVSALASDLISYALLSFVTPRLGISPSTLLDGTVVVISVLFTSSALEIIFKMSSVKPNVIFGEKIFGLCYNSASLGIVLLCRAFAHGFFENVLFCLLFSAATAVSYYVLSCLREDLSVYRIPCLFRGVPILLILLGLAALAFSGYAGAQIPEFEPLEPMF